MFSASTCFTFPYFEVRNVYKTKTTRIKLLVIAFGLRLTGHKLSRTGKRYLNCCLKKYIMKFID